MAEVAVEPQEIQTKQETLDRKEIGAIWNDFMKFKKENSELVQRLDSKTKELLGEITDEQLRKAQLKVLLFVYGAHQADNMRIKRRDFVTGNDVESNDVLMSRLRKGEFQILKPQKKNNFVVKVTLTGDLTFNKEALISDAEGWFSNLFSDEPKIYEPTSGINQIEVIRYISAGVEEWSHPYDTGFYGKYKQQLWKGAIPVAKEARKLVGKDFYLKYYSSELEYRGLLAQRRYLQKWLPSSMNRVNEFVYEVGQVKSKKEKGFWQSLDLSARKR